MEHAKLTHLAGGGPALFPAQSSFPYVLLPNIHMGSEKGEKSNTNVDGIRKMSSQATVNHLKGGNNHPSSG